MSSKSRLVLLDDSNFPIDLIEVGENIRDVSEKEKEIKELADSIKHYGQLEPIGIEIDENENGKFKLVYGHRRLIAISKILKDKTIKVVRVSSDNRVETQLIENIHRKDLSDLELAKALKKIQEQTKCKNKELAKIVSKSVDWVESKMIHLNTFKSLPEEIKEQAEKLSTDKMKVIKYLSEEEKKDLIQRDGKEKLSTKKFKEEAEKKKSETSRNSKKVTKTDPNKKVIEALLKKIDSELKPLLSKVEKLETEKAELTKQLRKLK
jgi:ParB family chromosome partitioning protein